MRTVSQIIARRNAIRSAPSRRPAVKMNPALLAACVEAGGFDQNAAYGA